MDLPPSGDADIAIAELAELICRFDRLSDVAHRVFDAQIGDWSGTLLELLRFLNQFDAWLDERRSYGPFEW